MIAVRCLVSNLDPILENTEFAQGMQDCDEVYDKLLPEGSAAATPYACVQALLRCYTEEVAAGFLTQDEHLRSYINTLDQGALGSHACVVLKHVATFDVGTLRRMYADKGTVWEAIKKAEDQDRAKMGGCAGRLLGAEDAYKLGAATLLPKWAS
jgi:hypothetical protein